MTAEDYLKKALKFEKENKYEQVLRELNDAIRLDSRKSNLYAFRGKVLGLLERDTMAIQDLDKAILLNPKNISAYYYKGISLTYLKKYELAITNFNKAISLKTSDEIIIDINPNDFESFEEKVDVPISAIRFNRGISFFESAQNSTALNDFNSAMNAGFNVALCKYYIGVIHINQNDSTKGCSILKEAIEAGNEEAYEYFRQHCK